MMSLTFGLFTQVSGTGPLGRLVVCVLQNHVQPKTSSCMVGFQNKLAQMIIMTRGCVPNKNHVARSKVNVTVGT